MLHVFIFGFSGFESFDQIPEPKVNKDRLSTAAVLLRCQNSRVILKLSPTMAKPRRSFFFFFFLTTTVLLFSLSLSLLLQATPTHQHQDPQEGDTPITRFQNYLRINTAHPSPDYPSAIAYLLSQARSIGLLARTLEFSPGKPVVLFTWPGSRPSLPSILFNSHLDSVPAESSKWVHDPFSAVRKTDGKIFARGAQDDKCIGMQYLEAIRNLKEKKFEPIRTLHFSYVPDEEIGGFEGAAKFTASKEFKDLNVGFAMDEGQANPGDEFRVFYADRSPWNLKIKADGIPGHGSRLYDNSAMENLMKSVEIMSRFRESQFDVVKAGRAANSEVISVNPVYLKAGIPSPTVSFIFLRKWDYVSLVGYIYMFWWWEFVVCLCRDL